MKSDENGKLLGQFKNAVFKLNGLFLQESELILSRTKLTTARTRLLGVLLRAGKPLTIPQIALEMGQTRQGLGRLVNIMVSDGYLELHDNPLHQKSRFVSCTPLAQKDYYDVREQFRQAVRVWPYPVSLDEIIAARKTVDRLVDYLEQSLAGSISD